MESYYIQDQTLCPWRLNSDSLSEICHSAQHWSNLLQNSPLELCKKPALLAAVFGVGGCTLCSAYVGACRQSKRGLGSITCFLHTLRIVFPTEVFNGATGKGKTFKGRTSSFSEQGKGLNLTLRGNISINCIVCAFFSSGSLQTLLHTFTILLGQ